MSDNTTLNAGAAGDVVRTNDRSSVKTPVVMLDLGSDGTESIIDGTAVATTLMPISGGIAKVLSATPTISASAIYGANEAVGGLLTFASAARVSGAGIIIETAVLIDLDQELAVIDLVLFDQTFTNSSDNAAFDPTDADLANVIGVIPFNVYTNFSDNSISTVRGVGITAKLAGTSLFGQLVTRGTPTYTATSDITVKLHIRQL